MFYGPDGVGKASAARLFAQTLQCAGDTPPCGVCTSCEKVRANVHPDVVSIGPVAGSRSIKAEEIREEVIWRAHQRPNEGMWQVFIIEDAHLLTRVSQNALLKTLEEPSAGTILILVTPNLHMLLPTIISRCRRLRVPGSASCGYGRYSRGTMRGRWGGRGEARLPQHGEAGRRPIF